MKRFFVCTLAVAAVCWFPFSSRSQTQSAPEAGSLLYRISGNGLTKHSYMFGTFHAICPAEMVPLESLDVYLDRTDQMVMEIDMDDAAEMQSLTLAALMSGGKTLKDYLTPEQFAKIDAMTKDLLGYPAENLKALKPTMLAVMALTSPKAIGCTPNVYDLSLMQKATAKKKPIFGLETVASQINVLDSKPIEAQAKELYEIALDPQKAVRDLKRLMEAYKMRDPEKLFEISTGQMTNDKDFKSRLLDDRNLDWIPKMETAIKERPTFFAVGAGHFGGKNGLINLLKAKGYQVTPVKI